MERQKGWRSQQERVQVVGTEIFRRALQEAVHAKCNEKGAEEKGEGVQTHRPSQAGKRRGQKEKDGKRETCRTSETHNVAARNVLYDDMISTQKGGEKGIGEGPERRRAY